MLDKQPAVALVSAQAGTHGTMPATGAKYHKADLDSYAPSVDFPPQAHADKIFSGMLPPSIHDEINRTHQARSLRAVSASEPATARRG